jgi:hypothetical protein
MTNRMAKSDAAETRRLGKLVQQVKAGATVVLSAGLFAAVLGIAAPHVYPPPAAPAPCDVAHQNIVANYAKTAPEAAAREYHLIMPPPGSPLADLPSTPPGGVCPGDAALVYVILKEMPPGQLPAGFSSQLIRPKPS